jgi:hypothetical protein
VAFVGHRDHLEVRVGLQISQTADVIVVHVREQHAFDVAYFPTGPFDVRAQILAAPGQPGIDKRQAILAFNDVDAPQRLAGGG